ncbi:MAG: glycosyltransferase family 2 protein [bacterium]|nr:glycosyltransferase family 2 protein [bacterium]
MTAEISVIVPTFNECSNVEPMIEALKSALDGIKWEVVFVDDDSPDGTADRVQELARRDSRIRCLRRVGRRGLASACIEGMLATSSPFLAVLDADLQHDERMLPAMLERLRRDELDIVVGSRYAEGGETGDWEEKRLRLSRIASAVGKAVLKVDLHDPMSGFFVLDRRLLDRIVHRLSGRGFKILLDIFSSSRGRIRCTEMPYQFRSRQRGESKLDTLVVWEFGLLLADKLIGWLIPVRFVLFVTVGALGVVVHLAVLGVLLKWLGISFAVSQTAASLIAMINNFILNNLFTYRDRRLRGWRFVTGFLSFGAICGVGVLINLRVATFLYDLFVPWWLAGLLGIMVGSVWNYAITLTFTWRNSSSSS